MGSRWENLTIQLGLNRLMYHTVYRCTGRATSAKSSRFALFTATDTSETKVPAASSTNLAMNGKLGEFGVL